MPYSVEETNDFTLYKAEGFFSFQDMEDLVAQFNKLIEENPHAKALLDFSSQTGYEEATIKAAFSRIENGFPRSVKLAIVYAGEGAIYKHILNLIAASMPENAKFFSAREEAEEWLKG